jgi:transposase-like protein
VISEVLLLHLHGLSSGDFVPALEQFLGSSAGLSPATVTRLTTQWQADHKAFGERDLAGSDYVYVRADGIHLRTTTPIESTFATVRLRTKVTRGAGSAAAALAMVFNLVESAQARRRAVNAPHLVALVRAGAGFDHGMLIERSETIAA